MDNFGRTKKSSFSWKLKIFCFFLQKDLQISKNIVSRKCVLKHKLTCFENVYASSESSSHCQQLYTHRIVARMKTRFGMFLCILLPSCKLRLFPLPSSFRRRFIRGGGIFYPCIGHDLPHHYLFVISSIVIRMVFYEHNQSLTLKISSCWDLRKQLFANPEILVYRSFFRLFIGI